MGTLTPSVRTRLRGALLGLAIMLAFACAPQSWAQAGQKSSAPQSTGERSTPVNNVPEKREEEKDENEGFRHSAMVQKLGHAMGLSPEGAANVFTALNFLVLLGGVGYLVAKNVPKTFRDRSSAIQRNLVDARTATEEANVRLKAVEARLGRLDDEIAGMRRQADAEAQREEQRAQDALETESAKIIAAAENEIQAATAAARRALQQHAAELAVDHAARRLVISAETDKMLVGAFAKQLAAEPGGQN